MTSSLHPLARQANLPNSDTQTDSAARQMDAAVDEAWQRLLPRLARSAEQARRHITARAQDMPGQSLGGGLSLRLVYEAPDPGDVKPGEPIRIRVIDVPPGAQVELPLATSGFSNASDTSDTSDTSDAVDAIDACSAWLVLEGEAAIGGLSCARHDYVQRAAGAGSVVLASEHGARLVWREARPAAGSPISVGPALTRAAQQAWEPLADGIDRRLLAQPQGSAAAYLVKMRPGAAAPAHRHRHHEECLVLEGEMFLDDMLLFAGDFQLARAGDEHHEACSERGVLLLVHGDLELDVIDAGQR